MATKYFNNAVDTDLAVLGNWWNDVACTDPAASVATIGDFAILLASATANTAGACNPTDLEVNFGLTAAVVVAATTNFVSAADINAGGNVECPTINFLESSTITGGNLVGTVTIGGTLANNATIQGALVMTSASSNNGVAITGNVTNSGSGNNAGTITGNYTITSTGTNTGGTVTGLLTVPGTQAGSKITSNLAFAALGTFGTLAISGIAAATGGGGGPLGGPSIEF